MNLKALRYTANKAVPHSLRKFGEIHVLSKSEAKEMRDVEDALGTPLQGSCTLVEVNYVLDQKVGATLILNGETGDVLRKYGPVFNS